MIPDWRGLTMKLRNMLAAVLLMCQCGCGHTYFAWNKPLSEQTEIQPFQPLGTVGPSLWGNDLFGNDRRSSKEFRRDMEQAVRTHFPKH
jgi:hypothetical protein